LAVSDSEIDEKVVQEALQRAQDALRAKTLIGEELEATEAVIARTSAQLKLKRKRRPTV
jgi:F-type H+-transporting ATPase subunit epsilon